MTQRIDKDKLLEFINEEIESCELEGWNSEDQAIKWELNRLKIRIERGIFDVKEEAHE